MLAITAVPTPGHPPPLSVSCHTHSDCPSTAFLLFIFPPLPPAITTNSKRTNRALIGFQSLPAATLALLQTDVFSNAGPPPNIMTMPATFRTKAFSSTSPLITIFLCPTGVCVPESLPLQPDHLLDPTLHLTCFTNAPQGRFLTLSATAAPHLISDPSIGYLLTFETHVSPAQPTPDPAQVNTLVCSPKCPVFGPAVAHLSSHAATNHTVLLLSSVMLPHFLTAGVVRK
ncbi:hypothetical protein Q8A73_018173 [Channa argus]|nr:hypothetical protein Q8A73_018173 [Channa argus]